MTTCMRVPPRSCCFLTLSTPSFAHFSHILFFFNLAHILIYTDCGSTHSEPTVLDSSSHTVRNCPILYPNLVPSHPAASPQLYFLPPAHCPPLERNVERVTGVLSVSTEDRNTGQFGMPGLDDFESDDQEGIVGAPVHRTQVPSPAVFIPRLFDGIADLGLSGLGIGLQDIELVRLRLGARHVRVSSNHSIPAESTRSCRRDHWLWRRTHSTLDQSPAPCLCG